MIPFRAFFRTKCGFVVLNLLAAVFLLGIGLIILICSLEGYTRHGEEVEVPAVTGMYLEMATPILEAEQLHPVVIDSTYSNKVPMGTIVEQNPPAGAHAKQDRPIYLVVNARARREVALPDLIDMSYRQAITKLQQMQLPVSDTLFEPSEFRDIVLDIRYNGESLEPGSRLREGTPLTLVVGYGKGTEMVAVPNLAGLSLQGARSLLLQEALTLGSVEYDVEPTEETRDAYHVVSQTPDADQYLLQGSHVDVRLSTDIEKAAKSDGVSEEEFF